MASLDAAEQSIYGDAPADAEALRALALRVVRADIDAARQANDASSSLRADQYALYRTRYGDDPAAGRAGRSRIVSSDVMDTVEWVMPPLMRAFAGGRKAIEVAPEGDEDVGKAEKNEKLLNWQFMSRCNGFLVLYELIKAALIYGTSYAKITWREDFVREGFAAPEVLEPDMARLMDDPAIESLSAGEVSVVPVPMPGGENAALYGMPPVQLELVRVYRDVRGERRIKTYSGPRIDVIPPEDLLMDPEARTMDDAMYVCHRVKRTISYLREREREGVYSNIDAVVRETSTDAALRSSEESMRQAAAMDMSDSFGSDQPDQVARRKVEVYEWWGRLDAKGIGIAEPYLVTLAGETIIRMERNPYAHGLPPFVEMRPILDVFRFAGIGLSELIGEFQRLKTALLRQTLDNLSFQNNQMWEVDEAAGVDVESLMSPRPGGIVFTNRLGKGFRAITPAPLQGYPLQMMEFLQTQLEQRSGVTRYNQGMDAKSLNKTATGISAIMGASAQRIELIARIMAESIRRIYKMMLGLNQQFINQDIVIRVFGEPLPISPDDLAGEFDVQVDIGGATGKDDEDIKRLLGLLQHASLLLQVGVMRPQNIHAVTTQILEIWGWRDTDRFLSDPVQSEQLHGVMQSIAALGQAAATGRIPAVPIVAQVLQQAYAALASVAGPMKEASGDGQQSDAGQTGDRSDGPAIVGLLGPHARQGAGVVPMVGQGGSAGLGATGGQVSAGAPRQSVFPAGVRRS